MTLTCSSQFSQKSTLVYTLITFICDCTDVPRQGDIPISKLSKMKQKGVNMNYETTVQIMSQLSNIEREEPLHLVYSY